MIKKKKKVDEPQYIPSPLNNPMINYKVYKLSVQQKIFISLLSFVVGGLVGLVFYSGMFKIDGEATMATHISDLVVFIVVGIIAVRVTKTPIIKWLKAKRDKTMEKQFIDFLENLVTSLSAGANVTNSFKNAYTELCNQYGKKDCIISELEEILMGMDNGKTMEEMLSAFGKRSDNEDIENFSNVMSNCYRLGGDFKSIIMRTRDIISDKIAVANEIDTKLASNKLQHKVMCIMPIGIVAMLKLTNPSFANNLTTPVGIIVTTFAIGIFVISYFWGQKIIDIR